jgi:hypothetical protein
MLAGRIIDKAQIETYKFNFNFAGALVPKELFMFSPKSL